MWERKKKKKKTMYIYGKYWNKILGEFDDSMTLVEYLADKEKEVIPLWEIFRDIGLDRQNWDFRWTEAELSYKGEYEFYFAFSLVADLSAILLECKVNGKANIGELFCQDTDDRFITITASDYEMDKICCALEDFATYPMEYDLREWGPEEDMYDLAKQCARMRVQLRSEKVIKDKEYVRIRYF